MKKNNEDLQKYLDDLKKDSHDSEYELKEK